MDREFSAADMKENKTIAALGYLLFFLPLILRKDSKLGRYCANQGLILMVLMLLINLLFSAFSVIPLIGWLFTLVGRLLSLGVVVVELMCFLQLMTNDRVIEIPYIGYFRMLP